MWIRLAEVGLVGVLRNIQFAWLSFLSIDDAFVFFWAMWYFGGDLRDPNLLLLFDLLLLLLNQYLSYRIFASICMIKAKSIHNSLYMAGRINKPVDFGFKVKNQDIIRLLLVDLRTIQIIYFFFYI